MQLDAPLCGYRPRWQRAPGDTEQTDNPALAEQSDWPSRSVSLANHTHPQAIFTAFHQFRSVALNPH
jgi:hypothetical protein